MTVPIPISKIVLVPIGHSAISTLPLMLSMLAPIKAPARGAAGIPAPQRPLQRGRYGAVARPDLPRPQHAADRRLRGTGADQGRRADRLDPDPRPFHLQHAGTDREGLCVRRANLPGQTLLVRKIRGSDEVRAQLLV